MSTSKQAVQRAREQRLCLTGILSQAFLPARCNHSIELGSGELAHGCTIIAIDVVVVVVRHRLLIDGHCLFRCSRRQIFGIVFIVLFFFFFPFVGERQFVRSMMSTGIFQLALFVLDRFVQLRLLLSGQLLLASVNDVLLLLLHLVQRHETDRVRLEHLLDGIVVRLELLVDRLHAVLLFDLLLLRFDLLVFLLASFDELIGTHLIFARS